MLVLALALTACAGTHPRRRKSSPAARSRSRRRRRSGSDTHGIEVAVPAAWKLARGWCGTPQANTVLWNEDGTRCACPAAARPERRRVQRLSSGSPRGWYRRHTTPVTIDGVHARRWISGRSREPRSAARPLPHRGITVTVLSPGRSLLADPRLRADRQRGRGRLPDPPHSALPTRPRPARVGAVRAGRSRRPHRLLLPGRWLDQSNRIGRGAAARLTRALDAAPFGFSRAPRGSILTSICGSTWRGSLIVARSEYVARPPVSVTAHLEGCSRLGASNGRSAVRMVLTGSFSWSARPAMPETSSIRAPRARRSVRGHRGRRRSSPVRCRREVGPVALAETLPAWQVDLGIHEVPVTLDVAALAADDEDDRVLVTDVRDAARRRRARME